MHVHVYVHSHVSNRGGDVAQLVGRRTGTPLTQVRLLDAPRYISPRVNFQCRPSYVCPYTPRVKSHALLASVRTLKIP